MDEARLKEILSAEAIPPAKENARKEAPLDRLRNLFEVDLIPAFDALQRKYAADGVRLPPSRIRSATSVRTLAAIGLASSGSSRAATALTAVSSRSIWAGKASRKKPEIRSSTSTLGRRSSESETIS